MNTGHAQAGLALRFFLPPPSLRPFVSTLYHMEISGADPQPIEDWLHPEWANLRIIPDPVSYTHLTLPTILRV